MRIIPDAAKQQIADRLSSTGTPAQNLIPMLMSPMDNPTKAMMDFWVITQGYDDLRGESYQDTFPEFYKILASTN
jgi:hypothetical protein